MKKILTQQNCVRKGNFPSQEDRDDESESTAVALSSSANEPSEYEKFYNGLSWTKDVILTPTDVTLPWLFLKALIKDNLAEAVKHISFWDWFRINVGYYLSKVDKDFQQFNCGFQSSIKNLISYADEKKAKLKETSQFPLEGLIAFGYLVPTGKDRKRLFGNYSKQKIYMLVSTDGSESADYNIRYFTKYNSKEGYDSDWLKDNKLKPHEYEIIGSNSLYFGNDTKFDTVKKFQEAFSKFYEPNLGTEVAEVTRNLKEYIEHFAGYSKLTARQSVRYGTSMLFRFVGFLIGSSLGLIKVAIKISVLIVLKLIELILIMIFLFVTKISEILQDPVEQMFEGGAEGYKLVDDAEKKLEEKGQTLFKNE